MSVRVLILKDKVKELDHIVSKSEFGNYVPRVVVGNTTIEVMRRNKLLKSFIKYMSENLDEFKDAVKDFELNGNHQTDETSEYVESVTLHITREESVFWNKLVMNCNIPQNKILATIVHAVIRKYDYMTNDNSITHIIDDPDIVDNIKILAEIANMDLDDYINATLAHDIEMQMPEIQEYHSKKKLRSMVIRMTETLKLEELENILKEFKGE